MKVAILLMVAQMKISIVKTNNLNVKRPTIKSHAALNLLKITNIVVRLEL